ncbi:hypothetical protein [Microbispora amethystogenes]|uniref:Protein kinase domain-containing protein n=1 Tax=Microbispora amethystogenes TaxID=1427754 RepID=A0ABQ4FN59_9ACTN|nr:hypothetical protein [Microbispora amethystogenes]GIH36246.1 hypothetical protein Mam01_64100 [Microbispora amethystogenes]
MTGGFTRLESERAAGLCTYYPRAYGHGRFEVCDLIAGAGQGYVLSVKDTWSGNTAVLKGMWWENQALVDLSRARAWLEPRTRELFRGLRAAAQATQLTQQAPAIIDVLREPSPSLLAAGMRNPPEELFIVQRFVGHGATVAATLADQFEVRRAENKPFTEAELLDLADQLCNALGALHAARRHNGANGTTYWIHADLKPENILVIGPPWRYLLIDYEGAVEKGKPVEVTTEDYAPLRGNQDSEYDQADQRFDLYMLGATLAEAAGLRRLSPQARSALYGTDKAAHLEARRELAKLGYGPTLTNIITTCLARPGYRLAQVADVQHELARARQNSALQRVLLRP